MGAAFDTAGITGLLMLKAALLLGSLIVVAWALDRAAGGRAAGIAIFSLASLLGVLPLLATLRPQGFSVLLFAIEAAILAAPTPRLLAMAPLFAVWANLHGGWHFRRTGLASCWRSPRSVLPAWCRSLAWQPAS